MTHKKWKTIKFYHWYHPAILLLFVILIHGGVEAESVKCPRYCMCYLNSTDNMRTVSCVARRLDSIDLSVPRRVQSLDLSNNSISILEDRGFQSLGLIEVVRLVLRYNSIRTVALHSFTGLTYLEWVDLSYNNLYQILPWTFHDNSNLKFLSLSGNPLGHIIPSGPLLDIPSLQVLELSNCNFGYFSHDAFSALPNIRKLDLSHNQLISFDIDTLQFLYHLEELDIYKNPWLCNANLKHLKDFLSSKSGTLTGSLCDAPLDKKENQVQPAKFEKIISVGVTYPEYDSSEDTDEDSDSNSSEDTSKQKVSDCHFKPENNPTPTHETLFLPIPVLLLISFLMGVCMTLLLGCVCVCCSKRKKKYQPLEISTPIIPVVIEQQPPLLTAHQNDEQLMDNGAEAITCPETPPPSYRELFMTINS